MRYDTAAAFGERESWQCVCVNDVVSASVAHRVRVGALPPGAAPGAEFFYGGGAFDGRRYLYLAPRRINVRARAIRRRAQGAERAGRGATVERGGEAVSQRGREDLVRVRVRVGVGVGVRLG